MGRRTGKRPELIIFDLDGTLLDTEPVSVEAWIQAGAELGLPLTREDILPFIGRNTDSIRQLALERFGPQIPFAAIHQRKKEISHLQFQKGIPLKTGVRELLAELDHLKIRRCIATSSAKKRSENFLDSLGLLGAFEFLVSGEEVTHSKPHPEIFQRCMVRARVGAADAMVIEDSKNGIIGARASGAASVLIPDILAADDVMKEHADLIFASLLDLKDHLISLDPR